MAAKTIFHSLAALVRKILFCPFENKIHIFAPPCNILYIFCKEFLHVKSLTRRTLLKQSVTLYSQNYFYCCIYVAIWALDLR